MPCVRPSRSRSAPVFEDGCSYMHAVVEVKMLPSPDTLLPPLSDLLQRVCYVRRQGHCPILLIRQRKRLIISWPDHYVLQNIDFSLLLWPVPEFVLSLSTFGIRLAGVRLRGVGLFWVDVITIFDPFLFPV